MDLFSRISTILCALCVFCTAAEQRRAEIYVDEDLYKDAKVLEAVQKYAGAVEKELNFKIDIKSFPAALVLDSTTLNTSPKFKQKSTAAELKAAIKESWGDKSKAPLAGVLLIGNLPFARMEYFARESDGRAAFPGDGKITGYQVWAVDFYFMDLDGKWTDELVGNGCVSDGACSGEVESGENGILDSHYNHFNGELAGEDFEIWVSRVNAYGEARDLYNNKWIEQLRNYNEYLDKVKELTIRWLNKAYDMHVSSTPRSDKALFTYSDPSPIYRADYAVVSHINDLSKMYNEVDVVHAMDREKSLLYMVKDYDWLTHLGHGNEKSFADGVSVNDFEPSIESVPYLLDLFSCNIGRYSTPEGLSYDRTVGMAFLFRSLKGGVSMIASTKMGGGYQAVDTLYKHMRTNFLGDAYVKWANYRSLVFESAKNAKDIYAWYYGTTLFGDPFATLKTNRDNVKQDSMPNNIALHALHDFNISGMCIDETQGVDGFCNAICGSTEASYCAGIHGYARIGSIYAKGGLVLNAEIKAKKALIYRNYEDAELFISAEADYDYVAYVNPKRWNKTFDVFDTLQTFPENKCTENVTVDKEFTLVDGKCINKLTVRSTGTLVIPEGDFYAYSVTMEPGSKYKFEKPGYTSLLHVRKGFAWKASPVKDSTDYEKAASGFKLTVYDNASPVDIDSLFYGSVNAPKTMLNVYGKAYGSFTGYGLAVHEKAVVYYIPFAPLSSPGRKTFASPITTVAHATKVVAFNRNAIAFEASKAGMYEITVMDVLGQTVASFRVNATAGRNFVSHDFTKLKSNRYIVSIKRGKTVESARMMRLR